MSTNINSNFNDSPSESAATSNEAMLIALERLSVLIEAANALQRGPKNSVSVRCQWDIAGQIAKILSGVFEEHGATATYIPGILLSAAAEFRAAQMGQQHLQCLPNWTTVREDDTRYEGHQWAFKSRQQLAPGLARTTGPTQAPTPGPTSIQTPTVAPATTHRWHAHVLNPSLAPTTKPTPASESATTDHPIPTASTTPSMPTGPTPDKSIYFLDQPPQKPVVTCPQRTRSRSVRKRAASSTPSPPHNTTKRPRASSIKASKRPPPKSIQFVTDTHSDSQGEADIEIMDDGDNDFIDDDAEGKGKGKEKCKGKCKVIKKDMGEGKGKGKGKDNWEGTDAAEGTLMAAAKIKTTRRTPTGRKLGPPMDPRCRYCMKHDLSCLTWMTTKNVASGSCANCNVLKKRCSQAGMRPSRLAASGPTEKQSPARSATTTATKSQTRVVSQTVMAVPVDGDSERVDEPADMEADEPADMEADEPAGMEANEPVNTVTPAFDNVAAAAPENVVATAPENVAANERQDQSPFTASRQAESPMPQISQLLQSIDRLSMDIREWRSDMQGDISTLRAANEQLRQDFGRLNDEYHTDRNAFNDRLAKTEDSVMSLTRTVNALQKQIASRSTFASAFQPPKSLSTTSYTQEQWQRFDASGVTEAPSISALLSARQNRDVSTSDMDQSVADQSAAGSTNESSRGTLFLPSTQPPTTTASDLGRLRPPVPSNRGVRFGIFRPAR